MWVILMLVGAALMIDVRFAGFVLLCIGVFKLLTTWGS